MALLARHVGNATVDDFVHLHLDTIRTLVVTPSPSVTVPAGGQRSIEIRALDALGSLLAGRLSCQWQVTAGAPAIGFVGESASGGSASVAARAQPETTVGTVHVVCGAASVDVPVTVTGVIPADGGGPVDAAVPEGGPLD